MDFINNNILSGLRNKLPREKVYLIPIVEYKPTAEENKMLNFYTTLMGYRLKWSHKFNCAVIYSSNYKRHGIIQKDGSIFYVVYGSRKEYLENIDNNTLTIIKKYSERKKIVKKKLITIKPGLSRKVINKLFGIQMLNFNT